MWCHQILVISVVIWYIAWRFEYHDSQAPDSHCCDQVEDDPIEDLACICCFIWQSFSMLRNSPESRMVRHAEQEETVGIEYDQEEY